MEQAGSDGLGRRVASGKGPARNLFRARFAPKSGADESATHAKPRTPKHTAHQANNFDVNFGKKMAVIPPPPAHLGVSDLVNTKALHRPHQHPTIAGAKAAGRSPDKAGSARASTQDLFSQADFDGSSGVAQLTIGSGRAAQPDLNARRSADHEAWINLAHNAKKRNRNPDGWGGSHAFIGHVPIKPQPKASFDASVEGVVAPLQRKTRNFDPNSHQDADASPRVLQSMGGHQQHLSETSAPVTRGAVYHTGDGTDPYAPATRSHFQHPSAGSSVSPPRTTSPRHARGVASGRPGSGSGMAAPKGASPPTPHETRSGMDTFDDDVHAQHGDAEGIGAGSAASNGHPAYAQHTAAGPGGISRPRQTPLEPDSHAIETTMTTRLPSVKYSPGKSHSSKKAASSKDGLLAISGVQVIPGDTYMAPFLIAMTSSEYRTKIVLTRLQLEPLGFAFVSSQNNQGARVSHINPGGLADKTGDMLVGDRIANINGVDAWTMQHDELVYFLCQPGPVELQLVPDSSGMSRKNHL